MRWGEKEEKEEEAGAEQRRERSACCAGSVPFLRLGNVSPGPTGEDGQNSRAGEGHLVPCPTRPPPGSHRAALGVLAVTHFPVQWHSVLWGQMPVQ